ncbi:RES domain-containing protein [Dyadobacter sp. CY327]|uniref:RES domain-containing protein n=1 Tax=Dyadobacter sp. CY327 TaxID=2907301 RepID=UPI001F404423|nr:RES domain-containing protein [Dyadobacter sp. CY327]MCE7070592.1 RES domain-containing protein [Dyadobacter sp. CY327]
MKAYKFLKNIELSAITVNEEKRIKDFLGEILLFVGILQEPLYFKYLYRITTVRDIFLDGDKVRNPDFISYPPLSVVKSNGFYGRANTPDSTVLYCSFHPNIALLEIKPKVGERIIISQWEKENNDPFISSPILNSSITANEGVLKTFKSFEKMMKNQNSLFKRITSLYFEFIAHEFVKDIAISSKKRFEYLFSAYISDMVLRNRYAVGDSIPHYDCIIYPSIAAKHRTDNVAICQESVKKIKPVFMEDCVVMETRYDNLDMHAPDKSIISGRILKSSDVIEKDSIIWNDD